MVNGLQVKPERAWKGILETNIEFNRVFCCLLAGCCMLVLRVKSAERGSYLEAPEIAEWYIHHFKIGESSHGAARSDMLNLSW